MGCADWKPQARESPYQEACPRRLLMVPLVLELVFELVSGLVSGLISGTLQARRGCLLGAPGSWDLAQERPTVCHEPQIEAKVVNIWAGRS